MRRAIAHSRAKRSLFSCALLLLALFSGCDSSAAKVWWENPAKWSGTITYTESAHADNLPPIVKQYPGFSSTSGALSFTYNNKETVDITGLIKAHGHIALQGIIHQNATMTFTDTSHSVSPICTVDYIVTASTKVDKTITKTSDTIINVWPDLVLPRYKMEYLRNDAVNPEQDHRLTGSLLTTLTSPCLKIPPMNTNGFSAGPLPQTDNFMEIEGAGPAGDWPTDAPKPGFTVAYSYSDEQPWTPAFTGSGTQVIVQRTLTWNVTYNP